MPEGDSQGAVDTTRLFPHRPHEKEKAFEILQPRNTACHVPNPIREVRRHRRDAVPSSVARPGRNCVALAQFPTFRFQVKL